MAESEGKPATLQELMDAYNALCRRIGPGSWKPECFYANPDLKVFDRITELNQPPTPPSLDYLGLDRAMAILTGIRVEPNLAVPSLMLAYRGGDGVAFIFLDFRTEQERADAQAIAELRSGPDTGHQSGGL
jgi:hypothetical protein